MRQETEVQRMTGVTIRRLTEADTPSVLRLVQLDSADVPEGELLGAEIDGRLVAIVPVDGGRTVSDPFSRTGELRALLELRAAQLRVRATTRKPRFGGLFARRSHGHRGVGAPRPSRAAPS